MRPHPQDTQTTAESGRVIYLGDVRRRRAARRRAPDGHYLITLALVAVAAWIVWGIVVFNLAPARLLTYLAFFAPLWVALAATGALIAYGVEWRRGFLPSLMASARRGMLAATIIDVTLAFQAAHRWGVPAGLVALGAALAIELALTRSQR
jgi:hypothetical protein